MQHDRAEFKFPVLYFISLFIVAFFASFLGTSAAQTDDDTKSVLIVYDNDSTLPAIVELTQGLRAGMADRTGANLEIYSDYLDAVRFPDAARLARLRQEMQLKYENIHFDVVMAVGPGALRFVLENREIIGNGAPIVFGSVTEDSLRGNNLPADAKGVISHFDIRKTMDLATALQGKADEIVVMTGSADFDKSWKDTAQHILGNTYKDIPVRYVSELSMVEFEKMASELSKNTIVLVLTIFADARGRKFVPRDATSRIAAVSNAPIYTVYSSHIGGSAVGGHVGTFYAIGEKMGDLTLQALRGDMSAPQVTMVKDAPLVDWAQIIHWGIDPDRIPPNAEILNYEMSLWRQYKSEIIALVTVLILQTATILALILQHRRRQRLEAELTLERLELAYLSRTSQLGELSGALAHELNQPLTSILANAEAGIRLLQIEPVDLPELGEMLGDIVLDNKRAATVITQLRRLMLRGETSLELMDLNQAVTSTIALARSELLARQTDIDLMLEMPEIQVRGNLPQLQQVILNLILNATDAMAHLPPSQREIAIQTRKRQNGFCELTVTDRGVGITPEQRSEIFKPFVSTKKASLGLGLAICRSIAQAHGGTLQFDESMREGARAVFTLPSA